VQHVEAHNFFVDWHLRFEGILGEKCLGRCPVPVHGRRDLGQVGIVFLLEFLGKTSTSLCESCRGCLIFNCASNPKLQFSLKNWRKTILKTDQ
jgi:hypothetical protein